MEYLLKSALERLHTTDLVKLLSISKKVGYMILDILENRIIRFDGSVNDDTLIYILTKYPFRKIDLGYNKIITDRIIDILATKEVVILDDDKQLTTQALCKLKNCSYISLVSTNVSNDTLLEYKNCKHLLLGHTKVNDIGTTNMCHIHTIDLMNTDITDNSIKNLHNCHDLDVGYTIVSNHALEMSKILRIKT